MKNKNRLVGIGSLCLAIGLLIRLWTGDTPGQLAPGISHFASGFLIGFSLVMLIAALMAKAKTNPR